MNSAKLVEHLGFEPFHSWPYDLRYIPTDREWHYDRSAEEEGSPELLEQILYCNPLRENEIIRPPFVR